MASYRHPEVYENPVFCQFGVSRPHIAFRRLAAIKSLEPAAKDIRAVEMLLWDGTQASAEFCWHPASGSTEKSALLATLLSKTAPMYPSILRRTRLGGFDLPNYNDRLRTHVSGVFDPKRIMSRVTTNPTTTVMMMASSRNRHGTAHCNVSDEHCAQLARQKPPGGSEDKYSHWLVDRIARS